jgi:hypothetical protein
MWAVVSSSAEIQVVTAWGVTCDPTTGTFDQEKSSRCRMLPILGSQIGNVDLNCRLRFQVLKFYGSMKPQNSPSDTSLKSE